MTAERWSQIDRLLAEALERPAAERAAFLAAACGDDVELRREVASLLEAHQEAEADFLSVSPLAGTLKELATEAPPSLIGAKLGAYRLLSVLGIGGMGEVYLARDTRLNRQLALKILPPHFVADAGRIERFAREARAVSALNHPNIVTVYDIGQLDGTHFIAMEYVDGQTLRDKILAVKKRPADINEVIEVALQIAAALSAAHAAGIIHRDIKPENVMVRRDDYVKVLDFGLAKLTEGQREGEHKHTTAPLALPARQSASLYATAPGTVLGTVRYMSPEQAQGQQVDARTDIFSLGVVLYEWLTGSALFNGTTVAATLDAVAHHTPLPLTQLRPDLSGACADLVQRMLEKDRALRYASANDLRAALKRLKRELDSVSATSMMSGELNKPGATRRQKTKIAATVVAGLLLLLLLAWRFWPVNTAEPSPWLTAYSSRLTDFLGEERHASFAPDGKSFFYARKVQGQWDIFWQRTGGSNAQNLTQDNDTDDLEFAVSFDGERIAFRSERNGGGLFVMSVGGDNVRRIADYGHNPAWSPDGKQIVFGTTYVFNPKLPGAKSRLVTLNLDSNEERVLTESADAAVPQWSPHGQRIAYYRNRRDVWTMAPDGSDARPVTDDDAADWNPVWSGDGQYLYFASERQTLASLWRVRIDEATGRTLGQPEPVTGPTSDVLQMDIARDGRRIAYVRRTQDANIKSVAFDPHKLTITSAAAPITQGTRPFGWPNLSPDGQWMAFHSFGAAQEDIWLTRADGSSTPTNLTNDAPLDRWPCWSPDGKQLAFISYRSTPTQVWLMNPDGSARRQLTFAEDNCNIPFWSPTGERIAWSMSSGVGGARKPIRGTQIMEVDKPWEQQTPITLPPVNEAGDWFNGYDWAPDGKRLVGITAGWQGKEVRANAGLWLYSFATNRYEQITPFGANPRWLADNRHIIYTHSGQGKIAEQRIWLVDTQTKRIHSLLTHPIWNVSTLGLTRDNRRLFFTATDHQSDVLLLSLDK